MINTNSKTYRILTNIKTWKIVGIITIIVTILDIICYGAFITCESLQNRNDTSFTNFNSIPEKLYLAHHDANIHNIQQGIKVKTAQLMNNVYDKDGVKHISYSPQTSKLNVEFSHQPTHKQYVYAQQMVKKFNHSNF